MNKKETITILKDFTVKDIRKAIRGNKGLVKVSKKNKIKQLKVHGKQIQADHNNVRSRRIKRKG